MRVRESHLKGTWCQALRHDHFQHVKASNLVSSMSRSSRNTNAAKYKHRDATLAQAEHNVATQSWLAP